MEERISTNETWDAEGKLIKKVIIKITTFEDGSLIEETISEENY